ncbi:S8 family serine peptidase [Bartonella taylorii]|uniref:S8 family serine peptidase n=1 Tax=Bartonella taylorii TaxID=33046 RepID=A0A9Q8YWU8_BARTA|nr:S8 family serine peptidase [Bartonella taylorii]OPB34673.1 Subtilase family protein [Bartonella taylorii]USP02282.1 S8 family serine peptidase [Bartonella taylorii]
MINNQINIYKLLGADPSIYVEGDKENATSQFELYLNSTLVETVHDNDASHLFKIAKAGTYHVVAKSNTATLKSNEVVFYDSEIQPQKIQSRSVTHELHVPEEKKLKGKDHIVDVGKGFYIEIKIKKGAFSLLKEQVKKFKKTYSLTKKTTNLDSFPKWHSIHEHEYYIITQKMNEKTAHELCRQIEQIDGVIYCSITPFTDNLEPPFLKSVEKSASTRSEKKAKSITAPSHDVTPDFSELQRYLDEGRGMNIRSVWAQGNTGQGVVIRHIDFGIYKDHEEFQEGNITVVHSRSETKDCNHGTASTGCIAAGKNSFGVTGIAHSAAFHFYDTDDLYKVVEQAKPGDIVSIDMQAYFNNEFAPMISIKSWWDAIKNLTQKQVITIMAAGNGGHNVGNLSFCPDYGDCGGILVGACNPPDGHRASFSNYGHRDSLINSWGWDVVTTGYDSLQKRPGHNRNYTNTFNGTSSATPLCCGALALLQSHAKKRGFLLTPQSMRALLKRSSYTEGVKDGIGRRPNVGQLVKIVDAMAFTPIAGVNPFPASSNYLNYNIDLQPNSNNKAKIHFDYRPSGITHTGVIAYHKAEGPAELEWYSYGHSLITLPVFDEEGQINIVTLKASKENIGGSFTMNSAADVQNHSPGEFDLSLSFNQQDNKHLSPGKYKGVLPLYVQSWTRRARKFPIIVNITIEVNDLPINPFPDLPIKPFPDFPK